MFLRFALHDEEWTWVCLFCNLLQVRFVKPCWSQRALTHVSWQHANSAQQAFLAASVPTLQLALLAIERLYTSWEKVVAKAWYKSFGPALSAGMVKLNTYYQRSAASDAHIMAMGKYYSLCICLSLTFNFKYFIHQPNCHTSRSTGQRTLFLRLKMPFRQE